MRDWVPGERLTRRPAPQQQAPDERPVIGVVALQGDVLEHLRALERSGARPVRVRRERDLDGVDAVVIPGGESTTIGRLLDLSGLLEPLRARLAAGMPAFGTCAGLILLSRALTGSGAQPLLGVLDVVTRRNAYGRQVASFEADLEVAGLDGGPLHAAFIRAPWIEETGRDVEVLARVDGRPVLVVQGDVMAASFHPEVTGDDRLHRRFVEMVRERRGAVHR